MGQNQWYHVGVGAPPMLVYFSGDWDVHCGYRILTQMMVELKPFRVDCCPSRLATKRWDLGSPPSAPLLCVNSWTGGAPTQGGRDRADAGRSSFATRAVPVDGRMFSPGVWNSSATCSAHFIIVETGFGWLVATLDGCEIRFLHHRRHCGRKVRGISVIPRVF